MSFQILWMKVSHPSAIPFEVSILVFIGITVAVLRKKSWWRGLLLIASQIALTLWIKVQVENYIPPRPWHIENFVMGMKLPMCYTLLALTAFAYFVSMLNLWCSKPTVKKTEPA